jgi:glucosamine kinase
MLKMSKLIIDSGSSKVEWSWIDVSTHTASFPIGIHPFFLNSWQIANILKEQIVSYNSKLSEVDEIYFYGTGINSSQQAAIVEESLHTVFPKAQLFIADDILAAARSLCQHEKGIACILGTGSNACFFDGSKMQYKRSGYGYILGDEGSGSYLGKIVIRHFLYSQFSDELLKKFQKQFSTSAELILDRVYRNPFANQYLASFTYFLSENRGEPIIEEILHSGIEEFFKTRLLLFPERKQFPVHFTGSIAFIFLDVIKDLAATYDIQIGRISKSPMEGLLEYHKFAQQ